jgi:hypothetical protein
MFEDDDIKALPKQVAKLEERLADAEARAQFLFDLIKDLQRKAGESGREQEKSVEKLDGRLKAVEQDVAKLKKK